MSIKRATLGDKIFMSVNYTMLILFSITTLYPFLYFLALSFNDGYDAMRGGIYLFPREITLDNYKKAFEHPQIMSSFIISVSRTVLVTVLSVFLTAMLAYGLTKKGLPGKRYIIFFFFFTTLFSGGLIPTFVLYRQIQIYDTFWVLVLPSIFSFYNAIIMRTFFNGIPESLSESALIDGANDLTIFFKIMLPLSLPVFATIALFVGVGAWNDWFTGEFFIQSAELRPAATLLNKLISEASFESSTTNSGSSLLNVNTDLESIRQSGVTPEALRMTFVVIIVTPIILIYPFIQKYFVKGVMIGSLKG